MWWWMVIVANISLGANYFCARTGAALSLPTSPAQARHSRPPHRSPCDMNWVKRKGPWRCPTTARSSAADLRKLAGHTRIGVEAGQA